MGDGEVWFGEWLQFMGTLPDRDSALSYFRRHRPAPYSWGNMVHGILFPKEKFRIHLKPEQVDRLLELNLVEADVAYSTWLQQQDGIEWPWNFSESPEEMARYQTRTFWFWSRQVTGQRHAGKLEIPDCPAQWTDCAAGLRSGDPGDLNVDQGLTTLARLLCAGEVKAPWQVGLELDSFPRNFEMNMGYTDAFWLWCQSTFDDRPHLLQYLLDTEVPESWRPWFDEHFRVDG